MRFGSTAMTPAKSPMPASTKQKTAPSHSSRHRKDQADDAEEEGDPEGGDRASSRRAEDERQAGWDLRRGRHAKDATSRTGPASVSTMADVSAHWIRILSLRYASISSTKAADGAKKSVPVTGCVKSSSRS